MEARHLRYFVAVAEELSFSRAAERLNIAQPPLSQQIKHLEAEIGQQLLERGTRPLRLTEAGRFFQRQALEILAKMEDAVAGTRRIGRGETGWLGIGYIGSAINTLLPPVLRRFGVEYPGVHVSTFEMHFEEQAAALQNRQIHIGFARSSNGADLFVEDLLYEERVVAAVPSTHPFAGRSRISLAELAGEPVVLCSSRAPRGVDAGCLLAIFRSAGIEPNIALEAMNMESALGLVRAGLGVTLASHGYAQTQRPGIQFLSLGPESPLLPMKAIYRPGDQSPMLKAILGIIHEEAATLSRSALAA
ncbi:transcriptional regulator CatR [Aliidongia dinghuensis]|uniref:Transcriptional regulator CatR n=1 Tax=Aliidongia dinghuensis TaxID=1867774 RepID=A0A8J2YWK0_9PROT|nr:LysR substrate-binding domain-containing protein [Aliidongia dinghuensis]GGF32442.1 transcriptional regulator CatR [Aliidongia dinghuensis]